MASTTPPRLHNELYDFIHPDKYRGALDGQVVVITGAWGTIGRAIAKCFSVAGAVVYLLDYKTDGLDEVAAACTKLGAKKVFQARCDVSSWDECEAAVAKVKAEAGPIDVLVNNAGVGRMGVFHLMDPKWFQRGMAVNLNGPYFLMRLVLPDLLARRRGCIINIASRSGTVTMPFMADYHTSKAALIRLTACVQAEVDMYDGAEDVHLYALHPGGVLSNMSQSSPTDPSIASEFPSALANFAAWLPKFKGSPYIPGMVSVALATGVGKKALRGRYFDCEQDLGDVLAQAEALAADPGLNALTMRFLGDLPNDGGMEHREGEERVVIEGFD